MANLQKTTAPKSRRQNSCPDGWLHAGAKVPIRLAVRQEEYCRQAIDIHRFCYNLAVRTHRFCRRNRLPWPSWMGLQRRQAGGPPLRQPRLGPTLKPSLVGRNQFFGPSPAGGPTSLFEQLPTSSHGGDKFSDPNLDRNPGDQKQVGSCFLAHSARIASSALNPGL